MLKLAVSDRRGPLGRKATVPFRIENSLVLVSRIAQYVADAGVDIAPSFHGPDPDYCVAVWTIGSGNSQLIVWLMEVSDSFEPADVPTLAPEHVRLVLNDLVELQSRTSSNVEGVPIATLDRRSLYAIIRNRWSSPDARAAMELPEVTLRGFSYDRKALSVEIQLDDERRMYADPYFWRSEDTYVAEVYGPLLPEMPLDIKRRAA